MKVWITKYALTSGIMEREGEVPERSPRMIDCGGYHLYHKPHWHTTKEEAIARVRQMIEAKLKSLRKQVETLEALREKYT